MTTDDRIDRGRAAFARRAWSEAFELLSAADAESPLGLDDLEMAGFAAQNCGLATQAAQLAIRLHRASLEAGDIARAARTAFYIGMEFLQRGDVTQGGGWLGRAARLLEEHDLDTVEWGYLAIPDGISRAESDPAAALASFERAAAYATRYGDRDLEGMARLGRGRSLINLGDVERGIALLDDAMVAATSDELSPFVTGLVYCGAIEAFVDIFDLRRAQDWTQALTDWSASQSDRLAFRGRCLVFRSELMRLHGEWSAAFDEAREAEAILLRPPPEPAVGEAYYAQAELHRLRGEFAAAETAYREASQWGRRPEPGLALLLLARGRAAAARSMIERALEEAPDDIARARLLPALGEIALATGDRTRAGEAVESLTVAERARPSPLLSAIVARLDGEVRLAGGDPRDALPRLRRAESLWHELDAPYDSARVRADLGQALQALGDADTAALEFDAALRTFHQLGAGPDVKRVERLAGRPVGRPGGLSEREVEVLRLVAGGDTNRAIASALGISERTVDRHVANIFTKLGVSSRAAATAFAVEHDLA
jgi:DNA-binding CsgD family transcriptional regulator